MTAETIVVAVDGAVTAPPAVAFERVLAIDPVLTFTGRSVLPSVVATHELFGDWSRLGATRELTFSDSTMVREEITSFEAGRHYAYSVTGFTNVVRFLLSGMRSQWIFAPNASGGTTVRLEFTLLALPRRSQAVRWLLAPMWRRYMRDIVARTTALVDGDRARQERA